MVKKKKSPKPNAEERILLAARSVFTTRGMAGARMQDIADRAGINKALLHYYFRDKDKLFEKIFLQEAQLFFPKINTIFRSDKPLFEKIHQFVAEYTDEMIRNPYLPWFVLNEINRDPDEFLYKIWGSDNLPKAQFFLQQVEREIRKKSIRKISPVQLLMHMLSLTIFPFIARPMFLRNLGMSEKQFIALVEQRKTEVPEFIIMSIKK